MPTYKKCTGSKKPTENWTADETKAYHHEQGLKAAIKAKKQEAGKRYKKVPILNGFKLVEIKS